MDIRESYDSAAAAYAAHVGDELLGKPLDRHLLSRFADDVRERGEVADLGCGPGHIARYLSALGVSTLGIDLSPEMVACARRLAPGVQFRVGDMRSLDLAAGSMAGVVCFYSLVHFRPDELTPVLRETRRVLRDGGLALLAFHVGDEIVHVDDLFGARVSLDFRFHEPELVMSALREAGFMTLERSEREPYPGVEYPSRRCYLLARASS